MQNILIQIASASRPLCQHYHRPQHGRRRPNPQPFCDVGTFCAVSNRKSTIQAA
jgi:hypothetical protein